MSVDYGTLSAEKVEDNTTKVGKKGLKLPLFHMQVSK